jgi:CYTH domain-containing protein
MPAHARAGEQDEIEVRFLCLLPEQPASTRKQIVQNYLRVREPSIRVRQSGGRFTLTRKLGEGLVRREWERELDEETGLCLMEAGAERSVVKTRHRYGRWEVDVYPFGLVIAELELTHAGEKIPPLPPELEGRILREVTGDNRLANARLAEYPEAERERLARALYAEFGQSAPEIPPAFLSDSTAESAP